MDVQHRDKINRETINKSPISNVKGYDDKGSERNSYSICTDYNKITLFYWLCLFVVGIFLFDLATRLQLSCEYESDFLLTCTAGNDKNDRYMDSLFNDTLARIHLQAISKLGNRPCGSTANEIHMPIYIINYIKRLQKLYTNKVNSNIELIIDEQIAQLNSFPIEIFGNHITSVYDQIKNIVVRLHDGLNDNNIQNPAAILINCHYDSFFGGIGASDDLASCVVMLETIHAILKNQPLTLKYDLIFLFNGAEENLLQASHAFISQHKYAKDVKLFVNLEAAGSGGRQMVFQTSQNNPWIISELASVLRQPLATVIGQEIFSANLIPSDTDFRIFRDFGRIPGIDIAFITNGYVYHTYYDTEDRIPQSCLRHTGINLLKLSIKLANSENIAIYPEDEKFVKKSLLNSQRLVYFDFFGLVLISYSEWFGIVVNFCLFLLSVALIVWRSRANYISYSYKVLGALFNQLIWMLTNLLLGLALGYLVDRFGSRMSWYSIRYNAAGLYLIPIMWYFFIYHQFISRFICDFATSKQAFECHRDSSLLILAIITGLLTICRLLSSYIISIWLGFLIINLLVSQFLNSCNLAQYNTDCIHFFRDTLCLSIPFTYSFYLLYILYDVFIPILGRAGPVMTDVVISGLTALSAIIPALALSASVYLTTRNSMKWLTFLLLHFSISYYIFLHCTHFGFPYNQSDVMPRKQRIIINHVTRNIRNDMGQTRVSESGIWIISLDSNKLIPLKSQLQDIIREPMQEVFCELRPYCGYPMLFPFSKVVDNSLWISQRPHQLKPAASIIILSKVTHISGMVNVSMQISGPSHTHLYLMTPCSMRLTSWSLGPDPPQPLRQSEFTNTNYRHYFIYYAYGKRPLKPLKIWIMFMPKIDPPNDLPKDSPENQIEVAVAAHYLSAQTSELETMLHLMPKWVVPTTMASTYEHLVVDFDQNLSYVQ